MTIYIDPPTLTPVDQNEIIDFMIFRRELEELDILFVNNNWYVIDDNNAVYFGDLINMSPNDEIMNWIFNNNMSIDPHDWNLEQKTLFHLRWN